MCFNVDGQLAAELIIGAVGQENWEVEIKGKASHAGVAPEKGISATLVGADRLWPRPSAAAGSARWSSRTATAPATSASSAARTASRPATPPTSSPTTCYIKGEARSPEVGLRRQDRRGLSRRRSRRRRREVKDREGDTAEVKFDHKPSYPPFKLDEDTPGGAARQSRRVKSLGLEADLRCSPTAASTPTGSTSTACRPSPSAPASTRSTPSRNMSTCPNSRMAAAWPWSWRRSNSDVRAPRRRQGLKRELLPRHDR